jgi:starvation-inducible outer membrane lipoprotein
MRALDRINAEMGTGTLRFVLPMGCVTFLLASCAAIPSEFTKQVDRDLTFADAKRAPEQFRGKLLLLGGTVSERTDLPDMTKMWISEHQVDSRYRPYTGIQSEGEFLVVIRPPVNHAQYPTGELVTVVGKLTGVEPATGREPLPAFDALYLRSWGLPSFSGDKVYDRPSCQRIYGADC